MSAPRHLIATLLTALACVSLGPTPQAVTGPPPQNCAGGQGAGRWELSGDTGTLRGRLIDRTTGQVHSTFSATLTEVQSPCLSCVEGTIEGVLDGVGSGNDYVVRGRFLGFFMTGAGTFQARIFRTTGGPAVGGIQGAFDDLPSDTVPGRFNARWELCP